MRSIGEVFSLCCYGFVRDGWLRVALFAQSLDQCLLGVENILGLEFEIAIWRATRRPGNITPKSEHGWPI